MEKKIASIKLQGLSKYLYMRTVLRYFKNKNKDHTFAMFGQDIELDLEDLEQKYLAADCVREPENLIVYKAIAKSGLVNTFIDIGANCGHVAASIMNDYTSVLLFEPNPKLATLIRNIFKNQKNIVVKECAIVDAESVGALTLTVPNDSSGLATLGGTTLSAQHNNVHQYQVKASALAQEIDGYAISNAYVKIDVEGFESNIIDSAKDLINSQRPIVGFEALSIDAALKCANLLKDYDFYCARFDFLEDGGALSKSALGIIKACILDGNIEVLKINDLNKCTLRNFSQIYSVPKEKSQKFEQSVIDYVQDNPVLFLKNLKSWS